jgi:hypothetical protein
MRPPLTNVARSTIVIVIHKGKCLSAHMSFGCQGVARGDLIMLRVITRRAHDSIDATFNDILRLADVAFAIFGSSHLDGLAYEQILSEETDSPESIATEGRPVIRAHPPAVSRARLLNRADIPPRPPGDGSRDDNGNS